METSLAAILENISKKSFKDKLKNEKGTTEPGKMIPVRSQ